MHCGLCLSSCPTYLETGNEADSPRGRIHLMRAVAEGRLDTSASLVEHLDLCLGCRACETACPSGVEYGALIEGARAFLESSTERPAASRRWRRWLASMLPRRERVTPFVPWLRVANALRIPALAEASWLPIALRRLAAMTPDAPPRLRLPEVLEAEGPRRGTAALLTGCVAGVLFPQVHLASMRLLARAGWRVVIPREQVCCGALSAHLGQADEAHRLARRNVNVFARSGADVIVANAAGCGAHLRGFGAALAADPLYATPAAGFAAKVRDVTELLAESGLPPARREIRARVAYHDACHLAHGQGVRAQPRALLRAIPGLELVDIAESEICCGSAGTYNLTEPDMAWRLAERKARHVLASAPDMLAAANPGCVLQIRAALRMAGRPLPVRHPVEILAEAHVEST